MNPLIEWDELQLRVRGGRIAELAGDEIRRQHLPIEDLRLDFGEGELKIEGRARKIVSVPFRLSIRRILVEGPVIRVPLEHLSAFGLPVPQILSRIFAGVIQAEKVYLDPGPTLVVYLDRFLPPFVDLEMKEIRIVAGGVAVTLGRGAADLPEGVL